MPNKFDGLTSIGNKLVLLLGHEKELPMNIWKSRAGAHFCMLKNELLTLDWKPRWGCWQQREPG